MNNSTRWSYYCVLVTAIITLLVAVLWSFFMERRITFDDFGLFNPVYTVWKYGAVSYPVYQEFIHMVEEPPTNYFLIGELMRVGLTAPYAEAAGPFLLILLSVAVVYRSKFSNEIKVSLLFGLIAGSFLPWISVFGGFGPGLAVTRPDLIVAFSWFGGLVALESGRLDSWNPTRLCLGSALLTLSSALHYITIVAWLGAFVYLVWVLKVKGRAGVAASISIMVGALVVAIPFLLLWFIPEFPIILTFVRSGTNQPLGAILPNVTMHIHMYSEIYAWFRSPVAALIFFPLAIGVPVVLLSTPVLMCCRETRGMALASLPNSLFLLLAIQRKFEPGYYIPELMIYASAFAMFVIMGGNYTWRFATSRLGEERGMKIVTPMITAVLLVSMVSVPLSAHYFEINPLIRPDELSIARAAGKLMLGPQALVGAQIGRSYIYGEAYWYNVDPDVLWNPIGNLNLTEYFSHFDAIGVDSFSSEFTANGLNESIPSWYVDGILNLRGFYFSTLHSPTLDYLLLSVKQSENVSGYGTLGNWTVVRFEENRSGNFAYVAAVCEQGNSLPGLETLFNNVYLLPQQGNTPPQELVTFISTVHAYDSYSAALASECDVHQEMLLASQRMPYEELVNVLDNDRPILFFENLQSAVISRQENVSTFSPSPLVGNTFSDDFATDLSGHTPVGWQAYEGSGTDVGVTSCSSYGVSKCVVITSGNGTGYAQLNPQLEGVNATSLEFGILSNQTDKSLNIYGLTSSGSGIGIEIAFVADGTISCYDGAAWHVVSTYKAGEWYDITITGFKNGDFDLYVNGSLVSQGQKMRTPGPVQNLEFQTYPGVLGGTWYLSSAEIAYELPGPAIGEGAPFTYVMGTIVFEGIVILLMVLLSRRKL